MQSILFDEKFFTRNGKISFQDVIYFNINLLNSSHQNEPDQYFQNKFGYEDQPSFVTGSAYSQARAKVNPKAFEELNQFIVSVSKKKCISPLRG